MSDADKIMSLLDQWTIINALNAKHSREKAESLKSGLKGRIKLRDNRVIIFDYPTTKAQSLIQKQLSDLMPNLKSLIYSEPPIADFDWVVEDYLELYANHYNIVISKLKEFAKKI